MKLCMVGLGSMGTRHLRNITALLRARGERFTIDALRSSARPLGDAASLLTHQYDRMEALPSDYDVAFITNPTNLHYETVQKMAARTRHMFIEKPVFDCCDADIAALGLRRDGVYYVACPLRYTGVIQAMQAYTMTHRVFAARAICSTYLPDWRPGDYRQSYSAHADRGGGVSLDLIHEWDYLRYLFGRPQEVVAMRGHYSELALDSDDLALYLGRYPKLLVSLHLDYFGRAPRRELELYTRDEVVTGDLYHGVVRYASVDSVRSVDIAEERDAYQTRELAHFLDILDGKTENDNDILRALDTLRMAKGEYKA